MASARCAALTAAFGTATVMPRPIAAGVFGMARTMAALAGSACSRKREVRPAMIESTTVERPTSGASGGTASGATCGLTAMMMAAASPSSALSGLRRSPRPASAAISRCGLRLKHGDLAGVNAEAQPAFQHGPAHLAGADQDDRAGEAVERLIRRALI